MCTYAHTCKYIWRKEGGREEGLLLKNMKSVQPKVPVSPLVYLPVKG